MSFRVEFNYHFDPNVDVLLFDDVGNSLIIGIMKVKENNLISFTYYLIWLIRTR